MTRSAGEDDLSDRDIDLENTIGCLLVVKSQIDKLRHRLVCYPSTKSSFVFKQNGKLYAVSLSIDVIGSESGSLPEDEDDDIFTELGLNMP